MTDPTDQDDYDDQDEAEELLNAARGALENALDAALLALEDIGAAHENPPEHARRALAKALDDAARARDHLRAAHGRLDGLA